MTQKRKLSSLQVFQVQAPCFAEGIAAFFFLSTYALLANFSAINYAISGKPKLKSFLTKTSDDICNLKVYFNENISLTRQCRLVNYSIYCLSLYWSIFFLWLLIFGENYVASVRIFGIVYFVLCAGVTTLLQAWIWFFMLIKLVVSSILVNQMWSMVRVTRKSQPRYAQLCWHIYEQSNLINKVFEIISLALITNHFGNIVLIIWSALEPQASCIVGDFQYELLICFMWIIAIVESGQRVNKEVRLIISI